MKRIGLLLVAAAMLWMSGPAQACTIYGDTLTGSWWYEYRQTPTSQPTPCGSSQTACLRIQVINKTCNDLQSWGTIIGAINWFGNGSPIYTIGHGPWVWQWAQWVYPPAPETAVFYWYDPTAVRWDRFVNCQPVGGSSDWTCTFQQSDNGQSFGGTSVVTLHRIF